MHNKDQIDHLLRRTGFGVTPQERRQAHRAGYEQTVRDILQASSSYRLAEQPPSTPLPPIVFPVTLLNFGQGVIWWLRTMAKTASPLSERLTLFWHRHFATNGGKVFNPGWMFEQNLTFRRYGNGAFSDLLKKMVEDPALLNWLDAGNNPAENPNENLARELLELFTLGIGNYTETDVKQLAKLTTGKRLTFGGRTPRHPKGEYDGPVTVLDRKGQLKLRDVAANLAVHPATANRIVGHLWEDFAACPLPSAEAARLETLWKKSRGNVTLVLRAIFLSPHFHDAPRQRVNSPVEYWVTCSRLLQSEDFRLEDAGFLEQAGEQLFFPPSVKGWDLGVALIHPSALQTRLEIARRVVDRLPKRHFALEGLGQAADPARYLSHLSGGQIQASTLPNDLDRFQPREALLLALASPDLWLS
jgi:uncharacterized protein (DUF1800 family)